ncbi:MAG: glycosyltransferase family 39 protein [candidate division FCPU426 bacterium]
MADLSRGKNLGMEPLAFALALLGGPAARLEPWLGLVFFMVAAALLVPKAFEEGWGGLSFKKPEQEAWEPWFYAGLLILAAFIRLWRLDDFPASAHGHEGEMVTRLLSLEGQPFQVHIRDANINWPTLIFYQALGAAQAFGWKAFSFRLPAALWGLLSVAAFYPLVRRLSSPLAAAAASLLFACSNTALVMARNFFPGSLLYFSVLGSLLFLLIGREDGRLRYFVIAGLLAALGLWGYTAGRVLPLILFFWLLVAGSGAAGRKGSLVFALCFLAGVLPLIVFALNNPHDYFDYMVVHANPARDRGLMGYISTFLSAAPDYLRMFHIHGDTDTGSQIPGAPILDPVSGALFPLGALLCLALFWGRLPLLLLSWLFLGVLPAIMGAGFAHPVVRRTIIATPVYYIFAALAFDRLRHGAVTAWPGFAKGFTAILVALCVFGAVFSLKRYFIDFYSDPAVLRNIDYSNQRLRKAADRYPQARIQISPFFHGSVYQKTQPFFFPKESLQAWNEPEDLFRIPMGQEALLMMDPIYEPICPVLEKVFPGSHAWTDEAPSWKVTQAAPEGDARDRLRASKDPYRFDLMAVFATLDPASQVAARGMLIRSDISGPWTRFSTDKAPASGRVDLGASFVCSASGETVRLDLPWKGLSVAVDGRRMGSGEVRDLEGGLHWIELQGEWPAGAVLSPLSVVSKDSGIAKELFAYSGRHGLRAEYFRGLSCTGKPVFSRRHLLPVWRMQDAFGIPNPYCIRISGILTPPASGDFRLRTPLWCHSRIKVDGRIVFENRQGSPSVDLSIPAGTKALRLEIETAPYGGDAPERVFELQWLLSGESEYKIVDYSALDPL